MTAVFHYLLFMRFCCPFILHLVELSSQLLTGDKAHSPVQKLPKINSPEGFVYQQDVCCWKGTGLSLLGLFYWKEEVCAFCLLFCPWSKMRLCACGPEVAEADN